MPSIGDSSGKEANFLDREQAVGFRRLQVSGLGWMPTGQAMTGGRLIALSSPSLYLERENDDGCLVRVLRGRAKGANHPGTWMIVPGTWWML